MGLGKTLTILALIVSDFSPALAPDSAPKRSASAGGEEEPARIPPTLIVCPLSVLHNWQTQIAAHTNKALRVLVYHGAARTRDQVTSSVLLRQLCICRCR